MLGRRVAIIAGVRTPFARAGTSFKNLSAIELGKRCVAELIQRTNLDGELVEAIVYGTVVPSVVAPNIAREVSLLPMLPRGCEAYTVGRAIVFQAGEYRPYTGAGRHLLADLGDVAASPHITKVDPHRQSLAAGRRPNSPAARPDQPFGRSAVS